MAEVARASAWGLKSPLGFFRLISPKQPVQIPFTHEKQEERWNIPPTDHEATSKLLMFPYHQSLERQVPQPIQSYRGRHTNTTLGPVPGLQKGTMSTASSY
ncbi:hypothetical protein G7K_0800-t1 [Saitoella complicata NRRL Y-17804]|uniref:Uncharacterized protein n=1 Tax=Saitoella complicata (strain BCRC 22490 / CBS 7301 / JCM 7358 / NBRC 10748 / NRRL Y-17804) TaxID=698492 RepID=A0A0E9NAY4_SAICN|nr:hypothetical protein G7K_0800-t1 [Saitoella complicata NRRL Y-17804]